MIFIALMDGDFIEIFCIFLFIYCHHSFLSVCVFFVIFCFCLFLVLVFFFFFFFQAEDGIRDPLVTGVSDVCSSDLVSEPPPAGYAEGSYSEPSGEIVVESAPPPPPEERMVVRPSPRHVWVAGYWAAESHGRQDRKSVV